MGEIQIGDRGKKNGRMMIALISGSKMGCGRKSVVRKGGDVVKWKRRLVIQWWKREVAARGVS